MDNDEQHHLDEDDDDYIGSLINIAIPPAKSNGEENTRDGANIDVMMMTWCHGDDDDDDGMPTLIPVKWDV